MKATVIALTLALSAGAAHAGSPCSELGKVAATVMTARQTGIQMSDLMDASLQASPDYAKLGQAMVIAAYSVPAYSTDEMKAKAVLEFSNKVEFVCYTRAK